MRASSSGRAIATRELRLLPGGRPVRIELDAPIRRRAGEWTCAYRIRGLGKERAGQGHGEDGIQSLQAALAEVKRSLEPFGPRLTWQGEPGELGLPASVPDYFGGEFRRRVERALQLETEREARRLTAPARGTGG